MRSLETGTCGLRVEIELNTQDGTESAVSDSPGGVPYMQEALG